jgi:ribosomal protein S18 acetylase RimI-like enzyme
VRTNASQSEPWPGLSELDPAAFGADLDALMRVYQAAMGVAAIQLPGRRAIMEAHAANPGFRGLAVTAPPGAVTSSPGTVTSALGTAAAPPGAVTSSPGAVTSSPGTVTSSPGAVTSSPGAVTSSPGTVTSSPGTATAPPGAATVAPRPFHWRSPGQSAGSSPGPSPGLSSAPSSAPSSGPSSGRSAGPSPGDVIAFAYGFHGGSGQWWHDIVRSALISRSGYRAAREWLDDSFEVAEVHVHPDYQRRGIGRRMLYRLTGGRAERTAVLSTMDTNSPARRLYRSLGFTDLMTDYRFSGAPVPYAVMGAALPLLTARS